MTEVVRNDVNRALRAYAACVEMQSSICGSNPKVNQVRSNIAAEQAGIWAREISPALRSGWNPSLAAADGTDTNLQTLSGTLVVQKVLELMRANYPILAAVTSDFSSERLALNQEVTSHIVAIPGVKTYSATLGWADATPTAVDVHLTIDKHIGVPLTFHGNVIGMSLVNLFDLLAPAASAALAKDMVTSLYALMTVGNFTNAALAEDLASFGRSNVIDLATALTKRGVPLEADNRTLLLSSDYFGALSKDPNITTLATRGQPEPGERTSLSAVADFRVVNTPTLPSTGNMVGFAFSRSALVIGSRLAGDYMKGMPQASYGNRYIVTDPQLGLAVQVVDYVDHKMATATRRLSLMYGVAVGNSDAGQILTGK